MRGADVLVEGLTANGVETVFALSGNQIMPIFDAVFDSNIRLVHTRHEAATVYMAEAFAQLTGRVGIALVTAGGGLGNATGALIAAAASDTPVVLLSGDSPVAMDGQGAFQEMDQTGLTRTLTKGSRRVMHVDDMADAISWAIQLAQAGRPGPVHLALPADVLVHQASRGFQMPQKDKASDIALPNLEAFLSAKRPVVLLGPSLIETRAPGLASKLQSVLQAPVIAMESPRGMGDPALGNLASAVASADHVLCLGKSVDFTVKFGQDALWPMANNWNVVLGDPEQLTAARRNLGARLDWAVQANPRQFADCLLDRTVPQPPRREWMNEFTNQVTARVKRAEIDGILPDDICLAVQAVLDQTDTPILICDGGEFGQWSQAGVTSGKRVINGVSGVIGGGLGYAIGAKAADPNATVIAMMGDGTIGFHLAEFETAFRAKLPFIAVIGNDQRWNAEHLIQTNSFGADRRIGCELSEARYDQVVAALGGFGAHVTRLDQLADALDAAVKSDLPACINVDMQGLPAPNF